MTLSPTKVPDQEPIPHPLDHEEAAKNRCFTPRSLTARPLILFPNQPWSSNPPFTVRFLSNDNIMEALVFVHGRCDGTKTPPDRSVYAYVWGATHSEDPGPHQATHHLKGQEYPHTAERAQLHAIITALQSSKEWKLERHNYVVFAFSGDYIHKNVSSVNIREQVKKEKLQVAGKMAEKDWHAADNLDLRNSLMHELEKMDDKGLRVRFWQIDSKYNEAEKLLKICNVPGSWPESDDEA